MPISCHFRDCKALLVTSSCINSAVASTRPLPFYLFTQILTTTVSFGKNHCNRKYDKVQTYHVPTSIGTFLLKASKLSAVVNRNKQLPDEQQNETDEDDSDDHSDDDCQHTHGLCTSCVKQRRATCTHLLTTITTNHDQPPPTTSTDDDCEHTHRLCTSCVKQARATCTHLLTTANRHQPPTTTTTNSTTTINHDDDDHHHHHDRWWLQAHSLALYIRVVQKINYKVETRAPPNFVPFTNCIIHVKFQLPILSGSGCSVTPKFCLLETQFEYIRQAHCSTESLFVSSSGWLAITMGWNLFCDRHLCCHVTSLVPQSFPFLRASKGLGRNPVWKSSEFGSEGGL